MPKVYIVSTGDYSDYGIVAVFLNKEKAEYYKNHLVNSNDIEEFETSDDRVIEPLNYCWISYCFEENKHRYLFDKELGCINIQMHKGNTTDNNWVTNKTEIGCGGCLSLIRIINNENDFDENILKEKYLKVCKDIVANIRQLRIEGFSDEQINEILNETKYE